MAASAWVLVILCFRLSASIVSCCDPVWNKTASTASSPQKGLGFRDSEYTLNHIRDPIII